MPPPLTAVRTSLAIGAMIVGLGLGACKQKPGQNDNNQNQNNQNIDWNAVVTCDPPLPPAEALLPMGDHGAMRLLPGGRALTPAGIHAPVGGFPVDVRAHPTLPVAYVANTGYRLRAVQVIDTTDGTVLQELPRSEAFYGLALTTGATRLYASGGDAAQVDIYDVQPDGTLAAAGQIDIGGYPAGLALSADGATLWVGRLTDRAVTEIDTASGQVIGEIPLDFGAYGVLEIPTRNELYVTGFRSDRIGVIDLATRTVVETLIVGGNPLGLAALPDGSRVYATVPDADAVLLIDPATRQVLATQPVGEPSLTDALGARLPASSPSGITLDASANELYVTRAADNAVALFDAADLTPLGAIPTGWYPTAVALADGGEQLVVTNGKGLGTGPLTQFPGMSGKAAMTGSVSLIDLPSVDLPLATAQVEANVRRPDEVFPFDCPGTFPVPSHVGRPTPIEHVVLIVRENKTYDVIFGDLPGGARDPQYTLFGEAITPNAHALARRFAHHDNFYDDGETSVQGHLWLTSSFVNDYMERIWLEDYRGNGFGQEAPFEQGQPDFGTFFTHLLRHGVDFTNYGEVVGSFGSYQGQHVIDHTDTNFPGIFYNTDIKDETKARYVCEKLTEDERFPPFVFILIPNDHTHGTSPNALTPEAMINDNDFATGLLVECISHSRFWPRTAIFIVEDDPQQGGDHVDYHRSIAVVASPWVRSGYVSSVHTSIPSLFRTFELILGLPPMNRYDALATPMWDIWSRTPDFEPYVALPRTVPDQTNAEAGSPGPFFSRQMDFSGPDRNRDLGALLWWHRRGAPPPGSRLARMLAGEIPPILDPDAEGDGDDDDGDDEQERDLFERGWQRLYRYLAANPHVPADLRPRRLPPAERRRSGMTHALPRIPGRTFRPPPRLPTPR